MDTLWSRVAAQAADGPSRLAVTGVDGADYGTLTARVEQVVLRLSGRYAPGDVLAVRGSASLAGLVAMLAVRRLGAAFLPVDAEGPVERREGVMREAGVRAVLEPDPAAPGGVAVRQRPGAAGAPGVPPETAYVMFTSGSTGRPKGVLVPEEALLDRLDAYAAVPGFVAGGSFLAMTAPVFDPSLAELLLPLCTGGTVVTVGRDTRRAPEAFAAAVERWRPGVVQATPTFWRMVLDAGWAGAPDSVVWCGGETLTEGLAGALLPRCRALWNVYGPTETTIWATASRVESSPSGAPSPISLGEPVSGGLYLVDAGGTVTRGAGVEGEIALSGPGVALGYLGDHPEEDRFTTLPDVPGRVYLTGDRARWRADGSLEYLGRRDAQVKLRGHRLELGEVEATLEKHPAVRRAVVLLCGADQPGAEYLAAAVATAKPVAERRLRDWLAERLPSYMVPLRIKAVPRLPLSATGKADRQGIRALLAS